MAANRSSAAAEDPIDVLFVLHEKFNLMDFAGPCEVLTTAQHDPKDPSTKAFEITITGPEDEVMSEQGVLVKSQIPYSEAHENMRDYDIMVILGGNAEAILKSAGDPTLKEGVEPFHLIKAFTDLQEEDTARERTLLAVCTGSLFLARVGTLAGLKCTTHPQHITKLEIVCSQTTKRELDEPADVVENERYIVENPRFDLSGKDDDPYVRRRSEVGRRPSNARKGSVSFKGASSREAVARREEMRLAGMRLITTAGVTAGIDASLYVVSAHVSVEAAQEVARIMDHDWRKGQVVAGVDV